MNTSKNSQQYDLSSFKNPQQLNQFGFLFPLKNVHQNCFNSLNQDQDIAVDKKTKEHSLSLSSVAMLNSDLNNSSIQNSVINNCSSICPINCRPDIYQQYQLQNQQDLISLNNSSQPFGINSIMNNSIFFKNVNSNNAHVTNLNEYLKQSSTTTTTSNVKSNSFYK